MNFISNYNYKKQIHNKLYTLACVYSSLIDFTSNNGESKVKFSIKVPVIGWNPSICIKFPMCLKLLTHF